MTGTWETHETRMPDGSISRGESYRRTPMRLVTKREQVTTPDGRIDIHTSTYWERADSAPDPAPGEGETQGSSP